MNSRLPPIPATAHCRGACRRAWPKGFRLGRSFLLCHLFVSLLIPWPLMAQQKSAGEYELKAAMLLNLIHFVDWPPSAYSDPQAPFALCILGTDPFGSAFAAAARHKFENNREVRILYLKAEADVRSCNILYISSSESRAAGQIFSRLDGSTVLTVGEMREFAVRGGMIQFSLQDQQVRFSINLGAASHAGLKISAKLLSLARIVNS